MENGEFLGDLIEKYAPETCPPCEKAGAKKMHELDDFEEITEKQFNLMKAELEKDKKKKIPHKLFIDRWDPMTLEQYRENEKDKWSCENCPLLKALNGSDSSDSFFLGMTVSSCDFRGKRISNDSAIDDNLAEEAFTPHSNRDLLDYAQRLEDCLLVLEYDGALAKDPYSVYLKEHEESPWMQMTGEKPLSEEEYEKAPHWREENIRAAIHWLLTLEEFGLDMDTSY